MHSPGELTLRRACADLFCLVCSLHALLGCVSLSSPSSPAVGELSYRGLGFACPGWCVSFGVRFCASVKPCGARPFPGRRPMPINIHKPVAVPTLLSSVSVTIAAWSRVGQRVHSALLRKLKTHTKTRTDLAAGKHNALSQRVGGTETELFKAQCGKVAQRDTKLPTHSQQQAHSRYQGSWRPL